MATRSELKSMFKAGNIPKESDFAQLMDSVIVQNDDGITKSKSSPLNIRLEDPISEEVIRFSSFLNKQENKLRISVGKEADTYNTFELIGNDNFGTKFLGYVFNFNDQKQILSIFEQEFCKSYDSEYRTLTYKPKSCIKSAFLLDPVQIKNLVDINNIVGLGVKQNILLTGTIHNNLSSESSVEIVAAGRQIESGNSPYEYSMLRVNQNSIEFFIHPPSDKEIKMFEITKDAVKAGRTLQPIGNDFAELFEAENGVSIPIGCSIVITNQGYIRPAENGDMPVGVISAMPGILGGNYDEWPKKYIKDEFGNPIYEEVMVEEEQEDDFLKHVQMGINNPLDGGQKKSGVKRLVRRQKINPDYDPAHEYIPRDQRPEWHPVGLLGQLHLRKGQPVAPTWVKIKDISENVELWLVK